MSFYGILKACLCIAKALQQNKYSLPLIAQLYLSSLNFNQQRC